MATWAATVVAMAAAAMGVVEIEVVLSAQGVAFP